MGEEKINKQDYGDKEVDINGAFDTQGNEKIRSPDSNPRKANNTKTNQFSISLQETCFYAPSKIQSKPSLQFLNLMNERRRIKLEMVPQDQNKSKRITRTFKKEFVDGYQYKSKQIKYGQLRRRRVNRQSIMEMPPADAFVNNFIDDGNNNDNSPNHQRSSIIGNDANTSPKVQEGVTTPDHNKQMMKRRLSIGKRDQLIALENLNEYQQSSSSSSEPNNYERDQQNSESNHDHND